MLRYTAVYSKGRSAPLYRYITGRDKPLKETLDDVNRKKQGTGHLRATYI